MSPSPPPNELLATVSTILGSSMTHAALQLAAMIHERDLKIADLTRQLGIAVPALEAIEEGAIQDAAACAAARLKEIRG